MGLVQQALIELDPAVVEALVRGGEAVLVDVREEEEFAEERVPGSVLRPMSDFEAAAWPAYPGKKTVIMCLGGVRSAAVARKLIEAGHPVAIHLKGGLNAWKDAGLATES